MDKVRRIIFSLLMVSGCLFVSCGKNNNKNIEWSKWFDNGDGTHSRHDVNDITHEETEPHKYEVVRYITEPTDITPGEAVMQCPLCGVKEQQKVKPTGNYVFDQEVVDSKYLYKKCSEHSAIYYKSSIEGAYGNPEEVFEYTDIDKNYTEVQYIESDGRQSIDTGIENNNKYTVSINNVNEGTLPEGFQRVEYIESSGEEYIDLPIYFEPDDEVYASFSISTVDSNDKYMVSTSTWNSNNNRFAMGVYQVLCCAYGERNTSTTRFIPNTLNDGEMHDWEYSDKTFKVSDINLSFDCSDIRFAEKTTNIRLFYGYNAPTKGRMYSYKHYKNGNLTIDLVPVIFTRTNEKGFYDSVSGKLFTNNGDGEFISGPVKEERHLLPKGYTELEYIDNNGTQFINTNYNLNTNSSYEVVFQLNSIENGQALFGVRDGLNNTTSQTTTFENQIVIQHLNNDGVEEAGKIPLDLEKHIVFVEQSNQIVDGTKVSSGKIDKNSENPFYICARSGAFTSTSSVKIFGCKIYEDKLIHNFVPAQRDADEHVGLIDIIDNKFYEGDGEGLFIAGENMNPSQLPSTYQELEYIESSGEQYIDSEFYATNKTCIETKCDTITPYSVYGTLNSFNYTGNDDALGGYFYYWNRTANGRGDPLEKSVGVQIIKQDKNKCYRNRKLVHTFPEEVFSDPLSIYLFARNSTKGVDDASCIRIYYLKIYEDNVLVRNYIPCYKKSDNSIGMFELVSGTFAGNDGTGTFIIGPEVNSTNYDNDRNHVELEKQDIPSYYSQLNYVESNAKQIVDTAISGSLKIDLTIKFKNSTNPQAFGYKDEEGCFYGVYNNKYIGTTIEVGEIDQITLDFGETNPEIARITTNGELVLESPLGDISNKTFKLFGIKEENLCSALLYSAKIYKNGKLLRNYVPAMLNDTLDIGLYDLVSDKFFVSNTSYPLSSGGTPFADENIQNINVFMNRYEDIYKKSTQKITSFKVFEGTNLVRDLVPVIRNTDSEAGLYDLVTKQFYATRSEYKLKAGKQLLHNLETSQVIKNPTYNEPGEIVYKCSVCGSEIHEKIEQTSYKVTFIPENAQIAAVKIFESLDPNKYESSLVGYSRNINTFNYSKYDASIIFEIPNIEGKEFEIITTSGQVENLSLRKYRISKIAGDCFVKIVEKK